ncbi:hypothetical protein GCK72_003253 [Caenorhabditis remanei]|uniref:ZP domain-containing protein n=1 Tax=Caenorhabditis remanei TaxID=31234 RepID=A0A6A5HXW5_CAERE|nr:hypothetical protein GCK72_003253 [Caenorhabditis remanei]KAF1771427.1 hypothetical protein GCK72_003253 [Caenorhabditis remanei]
MKFLSTALIYLLITYTILKTEKLSKEENEERLNTCGQHDSNNTSQPSLSRNWYWLSYFLIGPNDGNHESAAIVISKRHILTLSLPVLGNGMKWNIDGSEFNGKCMEGTNHTEVPQHFLKKFSVQPLRCYRFPQNPGCPQTPIQPVHAYILHICDKLVFDRYSFAYTPMILDLGEGYDLKIHPPCLGDTDIRDQGDSAQLYRFNLQRGRDIYTSMLNITYSDDYKMRCSMYAPNNPKSYGSPLVKIVNGRETIVGLSTPNDPAFIRGHQETTFFNVSFYQNEFCVLIGVCSQRLVSEFKTTAGPKTTTTLPAITTTPPEFQMTKAPTGPSEKSPRKPDPPPKSRWDTMSDEDIWLYYVYRNVEKREPEKNVGGVNVKPLFVVLVVYCLVFFK